MACIFPKRGDAKRGRNIDGWEVELFAVDLSGDDWPAPEAIAAYYGRNSFENRLAQQQRELGLDRIVSYHLPGQELVTVVGLALWNERVVRGFELARPPEHRPVQQIRKPVIDDRVPELWPRDPLLVAKLAELDWAALLLGRPGWRFDAATGEVRCDQDRPLTLTTVRLREGTERASIIFRRSAGGCAACHSRPACLHTERQDAVKHFELSIDVETGRWLHARLVSVRRPDPARIVPLPVSPGPLDIADPLFLPAEARHALREVFLGATLRVEVDTATPAAATPTRRARCRTPAASSAHLDPERRSERATGRCSRSAPRVRLRCAQEPARRESRQDDGRKLRSMEPDRVGAPGRVRARGRRQPEVPGRVAAPAKEDHVTPTVDDQVERYLRTGDTDPYHSAWSGDSFLARAQRASEDLRGALVAEVRRRSAGAVVRPLPATEACVALTRQKSEPMVRGLFPRAEQDQVLAIVERSVVCARRASTTTRGTSRTST